MRFDMKEEISNGESSYEMGRRLFAEGVRQFCDGGYFEAHDLWEEFWQELRGPDRVFVQALIHLAVGTYHYENGNMNGARSQLRKATTKLAKYPAGHWGVTTDNWLRWANDILRNRDATTPQGGIPFEDALFPERLPMAPR
jgi:hypothetical protein